MLVQDVAVYETRFERGLAADLQCGVASGAASSLRLAPVSGPEKINFFSTSPRTQVFSAFNHCHDNSE